MKTLTRFIILVLCSLLVGCAGTVTMADYEEGAPTRVIEIRIVVGQLQRQIKANPPSQGNVIHNPKS